MLLQPRVHIEPPDATAWRECFPDGLGPSAFSSPGFQRLMLHEAQGDWVQRVIRVDGSDLTLPVLGQRDRYGRWTLRAHPVGYDLMPIERARMHQSELDLWVRALSTPRIQHFVWWMSPWDEPLHVEPFHRLTGQVQVGSHTTYAIHFDGDFDRHLADNVSSTMRRYTRRNDKRGVTVVSEPTNEQIEAYVDVYDRSYRDNKWEGEKFSRSLYHSVARDLGKGGQLAIVMHEDKVIGGGILMIDPRVVHYFSGAIDRRVKGVHPHVALYTHALRLAEERGLRYVNLGGINEGNEGLVRFKTAWGAKATRVPMLTFTSGVKKTLEAVQQRFPWLPVPRRG